MGHDDVHAGTHEDGGSDEIDVTGLVGALTPLVTALQDFVEGGAHRGLWMGGSAAAGGAVVYANGDLVGVTCACLLSGTGALLASTFASLEPGFDARTGTTDTSNAGIIGPSGIVISDDPTLCVRLRQALSEIQQVILFGLGLTTAFTDHNDSLGIRIVGDGNWFGFVDNGGTETTRDTSNKDTLAHDFVIVVSAAGTIVQLSDNGVQIGANITTNIPADAGHFPLCGINTTAGSNDKRVQMSDFMGWVEE